MDSIIIFAKNVYVVLNLCFETTLLSKCCQKTIQLTNELKCKLMFASHSFQCLNEFV